MTDVLDKDFDMRAVVGAELADRLEAALRPYDDAIEDVLINGWGGASEESKRLALEFGFPPPHPTGRLVGSVAEPRNGLLATKEKK